MPTILWQCHLVQEQLRGKCFNHFPGLFYFPRLDVWLTEFPGFQLRFCLIGSWCLWAVLSRINLVVFMKQIRPALVWFGSFKAFFFFLKTSRRVQMHMGKHTCEDASWVTPDEPPLFTAAVDIPHGVAKTWTEASGRGGISRRPTDVCWGKKTTERGGNEPADHQWMPFLSLCCGVCLCGWLPFMSYLTTWEQRAFLGPHPHHCHRRLMASLEDGVVKNWLYF